MQTFDQHLMDLFNQGIIDLESAKAGCKQRLWLMNETCCLQHDMWMDKLMKISVFFSVSDRVSSGPDKSCWHLFDCPGFFKDRKYIFLYLLELRHSWIFLSDRVLPVIAISSFVITSVSHSITALSITFSSSLMLPRPIIIRGLLPQRDRVFLMFFESFFVFPEKMFCQRLDIFFLSRREAIHTNYI